MQEQQDQRLEQMSYLMIATYYYISEGVKTYITDDEYEVMVED